SGSTSATSGTGGASGSGAGSGGSTGSGGSSAGGGAGSTGSAGAAGSAGSSGLQATQVNGGYFPAGAPWYKDVSGTNAKVASDSTTITQWMESFAAPNGFGGAGMGQQHGYFTVDLSIVAIDVPAGTAKRTYQTVAAFHASPDCDTAPIPVPQGGAVEGFMGMLGAFAGY